MQVNEDCFGNLSAPFAVLGGTWTSSNTAVATSAGSGLMNGVSEGSVTVTVQWTAFMTGGGDPNATCNSGKIFPSEVGPLTVLAPTLTGPSSVTRGGSATFTIQNASSNAQISNWQIPFSKSSDQRWPSILKKMNEPGSPLAHKVVQRDLPVFWPVLARSIAFCKPMWVE